MSTRTCFQCFSNLSTPYGPCPKCGYDPASDAGKYPLALVPGSILNGRYVVGRTLGQGGFGITYVAKDVQTDARVAIKEYFPETLVTRSEGHSVITFSGQLKENFHYGLRCFMAEARTLARFNGVEGIVRVHRYFEENGTAYFVMDFVEGTSLRAYLRQQGGRIFWKDAVGILIPVMDALCVVHKKGIIHRDIAPDNISIATDGSIKLLDFGAARYSLGDKSRSLDVMLKAGYAPKEQYSRRGRQGPYTDVYSMAATFYCTITGQVPPESIERTDSDIDPLLPPRRLGIDIPPRVEAVLIKALSIRYQDRYPTMEKFRDALFEAIQDKTITTHPVPYDETLWEKVTKFITGFLQSFLPQPPKIPPMTLSANVYHTVGLRTDGTVAAAGNNQYQQCKVSGWKGITAVSAGLGHTVGVTASGTVEAAGNNHYGQCDVSLWKQITAVCAGGYHTVGLRSDGSVASVGDNRHHQCDTDGWSRIISVSAGLHHTLGLKANGTVAAAGRNTEGQCSVSGWTNMLAVSAGQCHSVGLRSDGTVAAVGDNQCGQCEVGSWTNIIAISAGSYHTVGLRSDGTVVSTSITGKYSRACSFGQDKVASWKSIVAISAANQHTVGLQKDGRMVVAGFNQYGQCNVGSWNNIKAP